MLKIYQNNQQAIEETQTMTGDCWVNLVSPSPSELNIVSVTLNIPMEFLHAALDPEEKSRVEMEDGVKLIIVDIPITDSDMPEYEAFSTLPMAIIITDTAVVTVCINETSILTEIAENKVKNLLLSYRPRFVFTVLFRVASKFLLYLYRIEKISTKIERQLNESLKNEQLLQMLALSKSLTYFSTSLRSSEITIKKIQRGHIVRLYEEDMDLLEDALIEISQAVEMAGSYTSILKATMETSSSVASNNLNVIMKVLSVITIVMAVPEITFGFYGMNVLDLPFDQYFWFPMVVAGVLSALVWIIIKKAKFYK